MFRNQSSSGSSSSGGNLVEFRAGRLTFNDTNNILTADPRKGQVYLKNEDSLVHFCWKDRTTNKVEDDLIVFPDDFEFKHIEQCKDGRVYVLKSKNSNDRKFFWLQEPKTDKDEEHCRRVNEVMNKLPSEQRSSGGGGSGSGVGNVGDSNELQYMLNNMSQQQLMQLFGGVGQISGLSSLLGAVNRTERASFRTAGREGNATPTTTTSATTGGSKNGNVLPVRKNIAATAAALSRNSRDKFIKFVDGGTAEGISIDLAAALANSPDVDTIVADPTHQQQLIVHLPASEEPDRKRVIKEHISSPQFQQALQSFTNALQSAQLGPLLTQFQLPADAVSSAYSGEIEDFVRALESALPAGAEMSTTNKPTTDVSPAAEKPSQADNKEQQQ